jgi:hypothetical protein
VFPRVVYLTNAQIIVNHTYIACLFFLSAKISQDGDIRRSTGKYEYIVNICLFGGVLFKITFFTRQENDDLLFHFC